MVIYYPSHPYSDNPKASIKFAFEICYDLEFRRELTIYSPIRETHFFCLNLLQLGLPPIDYVKRDLQIMEGFMNHDGGKYISHVCLYFHDYHDSKCPGKGKTCCVCNKGRYVDIEKKRFDSGVILLLSNTAFEIVYPCLHCNKPLESTPEGNEEMWCPNCKSYEIMEEEKMKWLSKGCEKEYTYAKAHHIRVYELESFLEGKEVLL